MATGMKHLVTCRCVLPQFKRMPTPPQHQFIVFSVIEDDGTVRPKLVQCNNCGIVHKIVDVCKSNVVNGKEALASIVTIDEIKASLPPRLAEILTTNDVDLPTWEAAQFIIESKSWGQFVVLGTDVDENVRQGKYLRILGENMFKIEPFTRDEIVK